MEPRRGAMYSVDVFLASSSITGCDIASAVGASIHDALVRCTICCCATLRCVALRFAATLAMLLGDIRHKLEYSVFHEYNVLVLFCRTNDLLDSPRLVLNTSILSLLKSSHLLCCQSTFLKSFVISKMSPSWNEFSCSPL